MKQPVGIDPSFGPPPPELLTVFQLHGPTMVERVMSHSAVGEIAHQQIVVGDGWGIRVYRWPGDAVSELEWVPFHL